MEEKMVNLNGVQLCTESFGDKNNQAVLLLMGATASMLYWDKNFCSKLADSGFFVIRYDNRDVGKSTTYPIGTAPYDIVDLVNDAIGILDHYQIDEAHFFGMSLGGLIAQIAAIKNPGKVSSLTLLSTGPWADSDPDLPEMDSSVITFQKKASSVDWSDEEAVVKYMSEGASIIGGKDDFDLQRYRQLFKAEFRRANAYPSMFNHATLQGGEDYYGKIDQIEHNCLIIHGDKDLIWNYGHALFLHRTLKNSILVTLKGTGHELHPKDWDTIITAIVNARQINND